MFKIAGRIIDFTDDPEFAENPEKRALYGDQLFLEKHAAFDNGHFALVLKGHSEHKRFPLYSKTATELSITHLSTCGSDLPEVFRKVAATHLCKAAKHFQVEFPASLTGLVDNAIKTNVIDLEKVAEDKGALEVDPADYLQKMARWWLQHEREMTLDERNEKADMLVKKADAFGYDVVDPRILAYSSKNRVGPLFKLAVKQRRQIMQDLGKKEAALEIDELFSDITVDKPRDAVERLKVYDSKHKLAAYYGRIQDPYRAVYVTDLEKSADDRTMGLQYKLQTIAAEGHHLGSVLSREGQDRFKADPVGVFQELPKVVQDYILAKFDEHLRRNNQPMIAEHTNTAAIRKRVENLRAGKPEYKDVYQLEEKGPGMQAAKPAKAKMTSLK